MVIGIMGEHCSGKSTLAEALRGPIGGEVLTGKDYLRLAKSEAEAAAVFKRKLAQAVNGENVIYVITEKDQLDFLPDGAVRVLVRADLETIKARFRARMNGHLPPPVEQMLVRKHGLFDDVPHDYVYDGVSGDAARLCAEILGGQV